GSAGPIHLMRELERGQLERACKSLLEKLEQPCQQALTEAHCTPLDIDQVILVGGMTRMPAAQERPEPNFGKPGDTGVTPDERAPAARGRTKVEVSFTMHADGILEVTAVDVGTGRAASVTIEASSGLSADEIARLQQR